MCLKVVKLMLVLLTGGPEYAGCAKGDGLVQGLGVCRIQEGLLSYSGTVFRVVTRSSIHYTTANNTWRNTCTRSV